MPEANEINSAFYALRLLSHHLDISEIEVSDGPEYPAIEFTPEEQSRALEIIRELEIEQQTSFTQDYGDSAEPVVEKLADRIEALATMELAAAGYETRTLPELVELECGVVPGAEAEITQAPTDAANLVDATILVEELLRQFSSTERRMLGLMREGHSIREIAGLLNVSDAYANRTSQKIKTKLRLLAQRGRVLDKRDLLTHSE